MTTTTILSDNGVSSGSAGLKTTAGNDGKLALQTSTSGGTATTAMTIDTSQNVGIGTSTITPVGSGYTTLSIKGGNGGNLQLGAASLKGQLWFNTDLYIDSATGAQVFRTSSTERMRIDSSGNVGIGTSSPTYQTQIYGSGQQTAALTDAGAKGGSLLLNTPTVNAGDGGALLIGAGGSGAKPFAAIKGLLSDGASNTTGSLAFATRNAVGDSALTERMRIDSAGQMYTTNGAGSLAKAYDCRAWVNFNGTGTVAIRASGNVTSITDNGVGDYTVNFTTAMPDANYCSVAMGGNTNSSGSYNVAAATQSGTSLLTKTISAQQVQYTNATGGKYDMVEAQIAVFR